MRDLYRATEAIPELTLLLELLTSLLVTGAEDAQYVEITQRLQHAASNPNLKNEEVAEAVVTQGGVEILVKLLSSDNMFPSSYRSSDVQETNFDKQWVVETLHMLMTNEDNVYKIASQKHIGKMLKHIISLKNEPDLVKNAQHVLQRIIEWIEVLINDLNSKVMQQIPLAKKLSEIADEFHEEIRNAEGIPSLVNLLGTGAELNRMYSAKALQYITSNNPEAVHDVVQCEGIVELVQLLSSDALLPEDYRQPPELPTTNFDKQWVVATLENLMKSNPVYVLLIANQPYICEMLNWFYKHRDAGIVATNAKNALQTMFEEAKGVGLEGGQVIERICAVKKEDKTVPSSFYTTIHPVAARDVATG